MFRKSLILRGAGPAQARMHLVLQLHDSTMFHGNFRERGNSNGTENRRQGQQEAGEQETGKESSAGGFESEALLNRRTMPQGGNFNKRGN
jgi:hypothetical protein